MKLRTGRLIKKRRYMVKAGKTEIEIDVFMGDHRGLVIAEVEFATKRAKFDRPGWLGKEVTGEGNTITPTWRGPELQGSELFSTPASLGQTVLPRTIRTIQMSRHAPMKPAIK